jgi:catechol 2,3-dioxygenase-like lactoylglutathione lyase family enzyme
MKKLHSLLILALVTIPGFGQTHPEERPHILAVDHVAFYTTAPEGVRKLYGELLGLAAAEPVEAGESVRYLVGNQWVGYSPAPDPKATDRMDHFAFRTDNIVALRRYLVNKGFKPSQIQGHSDHSLYFTMKDPEGHAIEFVERSKGEPPAPPASAISRHMIHVGFLVYNQPAEEHFYKDVLGFRPYWHGGMTDAKTEWVMFQVPDGTDWVEFMVNQSAHPDLELSGVMNHISLGLPDIKQAQAVLESRGWKPHGDEKAQLGRDGKWQLNLYDPDLTRAELMEFKPVEKPCCSDFTAPHPTE